MFAKLTSLILILYLLNCKCSNKSVYSNLGFSDTLKISYLDTFIVGKTIYPNINDFKDTANLLNKNTLLHFKSGQYYYIFSNTFNPVTILNNDNWKFSISEYLLNGYFQCESKTKFKKVDYTDGGPYLTGIYSAFDSFVFITTDLKNRNKLSRGEISISYCSISDSSFRISNIHVGDSIISIMRKLNLTLDVKSNHSGNIFFLFALSKIDNAWYTNYTNHCITNTNSIIFNFENGNLQRIQYLNFELIEKVLRKENIYVSGLID